MAIDWEPLPKPKRGQEHEFDDLFKKLDGATGSRRERLLEWFANASVPAFTLIGAPRVGFDEAADEWLAKRAEKQNRTAELEAIKREMHGYNVLQLLPPNDGFPVYSNYLTNDALERYAFNADLVLAQRDILGEDLYEACTMALLATELAEFAMSLHEVAQKFSVDNKLTDHVENVREPVFPEGSMERRGHILFAAAKWATYWSHLGHGMMPV